MESTKRESTKAKKITAPFYSLSSRHYGQTPSEIIREARASITNMTIPDVKPIFTNRPFTPKEKERKLFGNVKKRISRPPSAFSLSYLKEQDTPPRIKLPMIGRTSQNKVNRDFSDRSSQSLDNLIEEYEAEILQEQIEILQQDVHYLPNFLKTHSSPDERKMMRTFPLNDKIPDKPTEKRSIYTISQRCTQNIVPCFNDDLYTYSKIHRECEPDFHGDSLQEKGERRYDYCSVDEELSSEREFLMDDKEKFGSSLTHEVQTHKTEQDCLSTEISDIEIHYGKSDKDEEEDIFQVNVLKNNLNGQFLEEERIDGFQNHLTKINMNRETTEINEDIQEKDHKDPKLLTTNMNISKNKIEIIDADMHESSTEKSTSTELISDYLAMLNNPPSDKDESHGEKSKEILDLYETAEYYGVKLNENCGENSKIMNKNHSVQFKSERKVEENEIESANYLKMIKSNIENFDERIKQLDSSIEMFQEKLNQTNIQSATQIFKNNDHEFISSGNVKYNEKYDKKYHEVKLKTHQKKDGQRKFINEDQDFIKTEEKPQTVGWDGFWKNSYYLNKAETEISAPTLENKLNYLDNFVAKLITMNKNDYEHREVANTLNEMYKFMKDKNIFHNNVINQETKINILKSLYNFANNEDPEILLNMARIVFGLRMENNLSAACKMVFKVARSDENDYLFLQLDDILELLLQGIGLSSPLDVPESCIYGYGALKFLTMNHQILNRLTNLGILDLLILHLKMINSAKFDGFNINEQTQHALFQLTGALRNVAAADGLLPLFITTNSIPVICKILDNFRHCEDLVTNISRTLSLLSSDENAILIFMSFDNILGMLIELIEMYKTNDRILIRLAYCLGNIVAYNDLARVQLSRHESSVTALVKTLQLYADKDLELNLKQKSKVDNDGDDADTIDDVIVKVVRIIANMCMNPVVGSNLSPANGNGKNSLQLTQLLTTLLKRKDPGNALLACLGCLNNISYYSSNHSSLVDVTEGVIRVLGLPDEECQAEAARVLGNLTRHKEIRDVIFNIGGMDQLLKLLNSKDKEVFRSICGALVNLMLDSETRKLFIETHGIDKLVTGLENFSGDWLFACLICRAIWNSCADHMERVTSHNNVEKLVNFLANSLDEENENDGDAAWDEFAILATDLLEKINIHFESV